MMKLKLTVIICLVAFFPSVGQDKYDLFKTAYDSIICTKELREFTEGQKVNVSSQIVPLSAIGLTFFTDLNEQGILKLSNDSTKSDYFDEIWVGYLRKRSTQR